MTLQLGLDLGCATSVRVAQLGGRTGEVITGDAAAVSRLDSLIS